MGISGYRPRSEPRHKVLIKVRYRAHGPELDGCILDVSSRGFLMTSALAPARGEYVEVFLSGQSIVGRVVWSSSRRFGLALRDRINVQTLISPARALQFGNPTRGNQVDHPARKRKLALTATKSQAFSRIIQSLFIAVLGVGAAFMVASTVKSSLSSLDKVSSNLVQKR